MGDAGGHGRGGPRWVAGEIEFRFADPRRRLLGVRLKQHARMPGDRLVFDYDDGAGAWILRAPAPDAWRLEYLLELRHPDGGTETIPDPDNPERVGGAFGDKSVARRPDYAEPAWLRLPAAGGAWRELAIPARTLHAEIAVRVWSPPGAQGRALLANDGPEYDKLADLGQFSATAVAAGAVPPHHLVLLAPGDRNEWYAANAAYAAALANAVVPRLRADFGFAAPVVGMGASLGALAMLHAQRRFPSIFAGLFLQSGSFFRPRTDRQESGFPWFSRIVRFTGPVVASSYAAHPVPVVVTCGTAEENLGNNRLMAEALTRQGYPAVLAEIPDAHNYTGWRDAFHPYLVDLLRRVWGHA
jgi:enterochelin esterase-like enzyme